MLVSELSIEERVLNGARLLDDRQPGWELKIDLAELEMSSCYQCILGQVYSEYTWGLKQLEIGTGTNEYDELVEDETAVLCGFEFAQDVDEYEELGKAWTGLIKDRLDAGIQL